MNRRKFLSGLGILPAAFVMPKFFGSNKSSGVTREKFKPHPNPTDEEFNQDGWYFENGRWVMRSVCVRVPNLPRAEITVTRDGIAIKKEWKKPFHENVKGLCVYTYPKFVSTSGMKLPKEARVCYKGSMHSEYGDKLGWRIQDSPTATRDKLIHFTWPTAPLVPEGKNVRVIGRFQ